MNHSSFLGVMMALPLAIALVLFTLAILRGSRPSRGALLTLVAFGVPAASLAYNMFGPGRYAEFEDVKARLGALPGVELLNAYGHEDVTWEIGGFTIEVEDKGVIELGALYRDSFEDTDHICIYEIGGHEVTVVTEGFIGVYKQATGEPVRSRGHGTGIDVGRGGAFSRFFPFPINTVQDFIERHGEICDELATWPVQPDYGTFVDDEGVSYFYARRDPALEDPWLHPEELEAR